MLRLKTVGEVRTTGARKTGNRAVTGVLAVGLLMMGAAEGWAQGTVSSATQPAVPIPTSKIAVAAPVTYDNKYEFYGSINFMNFMAGQHLPKRMNLGGGEFLFTYWLKSNNRFLKNLGPGIEYRGEAGTTPVFVKNWTMRESFEATRSSEIPPVQPCAESSERRAIVVCPRAWRESFGVN